MLAISGLQKTVNPLARRRLLREVEERHLIDPLRAIVAFGQKDRPLALWLADRMSEKVNIPCVFWSESPHEFHGRFGDWQGVWVWRLVGQVPSSGCLYYRVCRKRFCGTFLAWLPTKSSGCPDLLSFRHVSKLQKNSASVCATNGVREKTISCGSIHHRFSHGNGQDLLLDAVIRIHREKGNARLVLLDQGPRERSQDDCEFRNNIRQRISEERLGRTVFVAEPGTETSGLVSACDGAIFSHRHETPSQHGEILSFLAAEIPTVLTDCAEVCELLETGHDARIIESGNEASLEQAMIDMISTSIGERKWMGTGGHAIVVEHFDAAKIGRRFLASIEHLLSQNAIEPLRRTS